MRCRGRNRRPNVSAHCVHMLYLSSSQELQDAKQPFCLSTAPTDIASQSRAIHVCVRFPVHSGMYASAHSRDAPLKHKRFLSFSYVRVTTTHEVKLSTTRTHAHAHAHAQCTGAHTHTATRQLRSWSCSSTVRRSGFSSLKPPLRAGQVTPLTLTLPSPLATSRLSAALPTPAHRRFVALVGWLAHSRLVGARLVGASTGCGTATSSTHTSNHSTHARLSVGSCGTHGIHGGRGLQAGAVGGLPITPDRHRVSTAFGRPGRRLGARGGAGRGRQPRPRVQRHRHIPRRVR